MLSEQFTNIALEYYEALDTPLSLAAAMRLKAGEWDQIASKATSPLSYRSSTLYYKDSCAVDFLRKLESLPSSIDKRQVCLERWFQDERTCFLSNRFIYDALEGEKPSTLLSEFFTSLRKIVHSMIGRRPAEIEFYFGKGSTYQHKGGRISIPDKVSQIPEMTPPMWVHLRAFSETAWARALGQRMFEDHIDQLADFPITRGNRWSSVPKTALTDRAIGIEPTLNLAVQLGVGKALRMRLNRWGLLLDNSQDLHRNLARLGSINGSLATIDLSSASDTVCTALVRAIIPDVWLELLESSRSPTTKLPDGRIVHLEKFSSMGNGYTFELETLIFASICHYVADVAKVKLTPGNFSVYGDDIIVPSVLADAVQRLLTLCGFTVNSKKSFSDGLFRESCGGDYFDGVAVRPFYSKAVPTDPLAWIGLYNSLLLTPIPGDSRVFKSIIEQIPEQFRLYGPAFLGNVCLHAPQEKWTMRVRNSIRYVKVLKVIGSVIPLERWDDHTAVASMLYGVSTAGVAPRRNTTGYKTTWVPFS